MSSPRVVESDDAAFTDAVRGVLDAVGDPSHRLRSAELGIVVWALAVTRRKP